jgi:hypothetical protein
MNDPASRNEKAGGIKKQKRPVVAPALPLRQIGNIVIWEGNYTPDTLFIGITVFSFRVFL